MTDNKYNRQSRAHRQLRRRYFNCLSDYFERIFVAWINTIIMPMIKNYLYKQSSLYVYIWNEHGNGIDNATHSQFQFRSERMRRELSVWMLNSCCYGCFCCSFIRSFVLTRDILCPIKRLTMIHIQNKLLCTTHKTYKMLSSLNSCVNEQKINQWNKKHIWIRQALYLCSKNCSMSV